MGACLSKGQEAGAYSKTQAQAAPPQQAAEAQKPAQPLEQPTAEPVKVQFSEAAPAPAPVNEEAAADPPTAAETVPAAAATLQHASTPPRQGLAGAAEVRSSVKSPAPSPFGSSASPFGASAGSVNAETLLFGAVAAEEVEKSSYRGPPQLNPAAERTRVHALKRLGISYTSRETSLDFITKLVANVCCVPAAAMELMDATHCYVKSQLGCGRGPPLSRRLAISAWVLIPLNPEVLVVEDLAADERFKEHPLVAGPPHLRFWAGAPLLDASGQRVGSLTIQDFQPRKLDADSCSVLCNFAEMLMREVQRIAEGSMQRSMSLNPTPENEQLLRSIDGCADGVVLLDVRVARWLVLFSNAGWTQVTGLTPISGSLKCFWDMFQLPGVSSSRHPWQVYDDAVEAGETFKLDVVLAGSSGKQLFPVTFKPATEALDDGMVGIKVPAQLSGTPQAPIAAAAPAATSRRLFYFGTISRGGERPRTSDKPAPLASGGSLRALGSGGGAQDDANQPLIPGVKLGPLLGRGSFGSVHYGTWNGAQIAVKVIHHMATEAERQARDEQLEAILGLKMLHPNIVRTFQFSTRDRSASRPTTLSERARLELNGLLPEEEVVEHRKMMETWIVLELCNRGSLQEAIDKGAFRQREGLHAGTPNMVNLMRTAIEIAGALTHLHSLDILHSDLNGNNILLISNTGIDDRPFSVKVSDFGLSRIHIGERTVATQTYGTVTHMPPELLSEGRLSKAADVYAFGVLLWEMYTGQRPWAGLRHVQIITHKMRNGTQLMWPPHVDAEFKDVAQRCIHPDPHQRPTFAEVLEMLEPVRERAERGELQSRASPPANGRIDGAGRAEIGALLGSVKKIEEGDEGVRT